MSPLLRLSVVIPTHDRVDKLDTTLDYLAKQTVKDGWDVLVVANNCSDATAQQVRSRVASFPVRLTVLEEPIPGAAAARNAGARFSSALDLLFLDDDILVEPECIQRLFVDREAQPDAWYVGQVFPLPEHRATPFGRFRAAALPQVAVDGPITSVEWFASGIALIPRSALLQLGGYEETFTTAALEDADLVIRAVRAGHQVLFDPGLTSLHNDWAGTSIRDFCRRQQVHCATAPLLARRFGSDSHPWSQLIIRNQPPRWRSDPPLMLARKLLKAAAATGCLQSALLMSAEWLERVRAPQDMLWLVYRCAIAGSMYAGYQVGLGDLSERFPGDPPPSASG